MRLEELLRIITRRHTHLIGDLMRGEFWESEVPWRDAPCLAESRGIIR